MPEKLTVLLVILGLVSLTGPADASPQDPGQSVAIDGVPVAEMSGVERLPQNEIPRYYLVDQFFRSAGHLLTVESPAYELFVAELGVAPGSKWDAVVEAALLQAKPILDRETMDLTLADDPEAFMKFQRKAQDRQARDLAKVYRSFLREMRKEGYPIERFELFLESTIRPGMAVFMTDPASDRESLMRKAGEFESELKKP